MKIKRGVLENNLSNRHGTGWVYQDELQSVKLVFPEADRIDAATDRFVSGGCMMSHSSVADFVIFSDVTVNSSCKIASSVVLPTVTINQLVVLQKVLIDRG